MSRHILKYRGGHEPQCRSGESSRGVDPDGIHRILYPPLVRSTAADADGVAYLDGNGNVVECDDRAKEILSEIFGKRFLEKPSSAGNGARSTFSDRFGNFLYGLPDPSNGEFPIDFSLGTVLFRFHLLESSEIRRCYLNTPQVLLTIRRISPANLRDGRDPEPVVRRFDLTMRETDIVNLIRLGFSNAEIAGKLGITPSTVKRHVYNVFNKTGVDSRTQLINILNMCANRLNHRETARINSE